MSKFANLFLKSLNEDKEGNAFTAGLAKTKKGGTFKVGGEEVKDNSNYDAPLTKEAKDKLLLGKSKLAEKKKTMKEAAGDMPAAPEGEDSEAWKKSLDKGTNPEDFDTADNPQHEVDVSGIAAAHEWIKKLVETAEFVNGTGPESLNSQINQLELKNSVPFRGVVRREEKRITKLAENLRGLAEVLKSVVITSEKKVKDATSPR
jgi:hypothetical protein